MCDNNYLFRISEIKMEYKGLYSIAGHWELCEKCTKPFSEKIQNFLDHTEGLNMTNIGLLVAMLFICGGIVNVCPRTGALILVFFFTKYWIP